MSRSIGSIHSRWFALDATIDMNVQMPQHHSNRFERGAHCGGALAAESVGVGPQKVGDPGGAQQCSRPDASNVPTRHPVPHMRGRNRRAVKPGSLIRSGLRSADAGPPAAHLVGGLLCGQPATQIGPSLGGLRARDYRFACTPRVLVRTTSKRETRCERQGSIRILRVPAQINW